MCSAYGRFGQREEDNRSDSRRYIDFGADRLIFSFNHVPARSEEQLYRKHSLTCGMPSVPRRGSPTVAVGANPRKGIDKISSRTLAGSTNSVMGDPFRVMSLRHYLYQGFRPAFRGTTVGKSLRDFQESCFIQNRSVNSLSNRTNFWQLL